MCFWFFKSIYSFLDDEDEDVVVERKRIMLGEGKDDILRLENFIKVCGICIFSRGLKF